ncbi:MAG: hypothetical protein DME26_15940 [Verrucomicrobia bacterium]|nr:MAG: hypothetical protein DME26_15940 [Verrucomicrobiota bacterium]
MPHSRPDGERIVALEKNEGKDQTMSTDGKTKWSIEADYLQACNCDYGCPCEFEAPPTKGFCDGIGIWLVTRGNSGTITLNGLGLGFAAHWPKAIHQGNGTVALFIDERANPQQREALWNIATGQAGGLPFEILATTFSKVLDPQYLPLQFHLQGKNSHAGFGNGKGIRIAMEPVKNPVTGEPEGVSVRHETGFVFKEADVVSAKEGRVVLEELSFSWPNKAGFVAKIKYGN